MQELQGSQCKVCDYNIRRYYYFFYRLRTLSDSGTSNSSSGTLLTPPATSTFGPPQYKLAEHRYGREEMLALYTPMSSIVLDLSDTSIMLPKPLRPLSVEPMSEEEQVGQPF